ncbi:efflux RND transporter periplasmic adaptor subunit [Noviherbaspirillum sedimenti]|uniref:Efflux RND transporter periplasmic adaptor subunit n=1 Tax=Noviherbaspirillum sedimenti TaxID=2320865 RepID=A0A3A3G4W1_9BURK|nr:efflux RND transporter periplasmic adaptor subunit [Noviherbaspirillum sedimenti]RJG03517.1 efflux RND transporter periplasmic adaptor subunit [Noviherbaspirillum sedimenti]
MKINLTKKQSLSILAIVAVGILLGALILMTGGTKPESGEDAHGHGPARAGQHADAKGRDKHADDEHGHGEGREAEHGKDPHAGEEAAEGKVELDDARIKAAGITVAKAGPAKIGSVITLPGEIRFNEDRTAHVVPRLAGVVESVRVNLGEQVKKGQVLAVIASSDLAEQRATLLSAQKRLALAKTTHAREKALWQEKISAEQDYLQAQQAMSEAEIAVRNAQEKLSAIGATGKFSSDLNRYEIRAPFDGMVMEKHLSLGEAVKEDASIFTISDLSTVWAEIAVPASNLNAVRVGGNVTIRATAFDARATGKIAYVGALLGEQTRVAKARVVLANPDLAWRPGLFVNVDIVSSQADAAVTVASDAVQTHEDKPVIFVRVPGGFRAQEITLGRSDGKRVEIVKGLQAGAEYAGTGSFIIRSELGKASAEHAH